MITDQIGLHSVLLPLFINPFTPEGDQCQNSPAASQEIWHHTVWRTWLFIAYSDEKWLYYKFSLHHSYNRFLKGWENTLFELRSERVNPGLNKSGVWWFGANFPIRQAGFFGQSLYAWQQSLADKSSWRIWLEMELWATSKQFWARKPEVSAFAQS